MPRQRGISIDQFKALLREKDAGGKADRHNQRVLEKHYGGIVPSLEASAPSQPTAASQDGVARRRHAPRSAVAQAVQPGAESGPSEKAVQRAIVDALREAGYIVLETSQQRRSKVSIGLPDLFVGRRGQAYWLALEVKASAEARRSKEQKAFAAAGLTHFVWSVEGALTLSAQVLGANGR